MGMVIEVDGAGDRRECGWLKEGANWVGLWRQQCGLVGGGWHKLDDRVGTGIKGVGIGKELGESWERRGREGVGTENKWVGTGRDKIGNWEEGNGH